MSIVWFTFGQNVFSYIRLIQRRIDLWSRQTQFLSVSSKSRVMTIVISDTVFRFLWIDFQDKKGRLK